ncbi:MAG: hypothetical protein UY64_C0054G0005 [Parcubacteria group bacterium GW2011_GWA1_51_12]|nr:MAG: hypothetical protein UY64_C0054G0005 [Parcubacteria group bacterium GW2011_GWA1_51_12]
MEGKRLLFILILVGVFVAGVTLLKESFTRPNNGGLGGAGDPGTIRGVVSALLPSGKVIVVEKEDGSAAGIRGEKDNVLIPSLVTVKTAYAYNGIMVVRAPLLRYQYFSLRYNVKDWAVGKSPNELQLLSVSDCRLAAGAGDATIGDTWEKTELERKIGGNVFRDIRYQESELPAHRALFLEDAGLKYGLANSGAFGAYVFQVYYARPLSATKLAACMRAVDAVLETFVLRNASERILVIEPEAPIRVKGGETVVIYGMAKPYDDSVEIVVIDENEKILWRTTALAMKREGQIFGSFRVTAGPFGNPIFAP